MGSYFYMIHRNIKSRAALHPICARLIPAALVLLFCAITTPYPPGGNLPLKSVLHIVFAFLSAVLVLLYLLWIIRTRYQTEPGAYRPFLYGWGAIVGVSVILFGGGRNHQQRPGDLCDADIRCHGAASGLQGCRTGGNAGQRRKHIRRRFPGEIPGKTPQSSIDIKKGIYI